MNAMCWLWSFGFTLYVCEWRKINFPNNYCIAFQTK